MPFKPLPFYPVCDLKTEQNSAPEAVLPPPPLAKRGADQTSSVNVKGERRLFWGEHGCRDGNGAGGRVWRTDAAHRLRPAAHAGSWGAGTNQGHATALPATDCNCSASQHRKGFISAPYEVRYYPVISPYLHLSHVLSFSPFHLPTSPWLQAGLHNSSNNYC